MIRHVLAAAALSLAALFSTVSQGAAAVVYTMTGSSDFFGPAGLQDFTLTLTRPTFITGAQADYAFDSCTIGDGTLFTCVSGTFGPSPNDFGGTDDSFGFNFDSPAFGYGGGGFIFFAEGAFGAVGTYLSFVGGAPNTPCYGSFGTATLTVTNTLPPVPLPAAGLLLAGGLGALTLFRRRRA